MPTVDMLPAATTVSDSDEILVSQGGLTHKATRAQVLASAQPAIALGSGQLLGRSDAAPGPPQPITLGSNLSLSNGVLAGSVSPFVINGLPGSEPPRSADLVALSQSGRDVAASYAQLMAGLPSVPGISANSLMAQATHATNTRLLADILADAVHIEDFGAIGDGVTDNTASFAAALSAGAPIRLGPGVYVLNGQFTISGATVTLIGVPGQTVLHRGSQAGGGAWISVQSAIFHAEGITFDSNASVAADSWGVLVTPSCLQSDFQRCSFVNTRGALLGSGLVFQAADPAVTRHTVSSCEAFGNAVHGIWVQALQNVRIINCSAHDNASYGICIDYADPALVQKLHSCQIVSCIAYNNQRGISVGNFNATNTVPPVWGNADPDAIGILVANNLCHDNAIYGIAAAGRSLGVLSNMLLNNGVPGGAGILANVAYSRIGGNLVAGASQYGIDAGGSINTDIAANHISDAVHGITPGGSLDVQVRGNYIQDCTGWSILVNNVETDGDGLNFGIACRNLAIIDNWIGFSVSGGGGGILLLDNPQNVAIINNSVVGSGAASIGQGLWPHSNAVTISGNSWNLGRRAAVTPSTSGAGTQLLFPDLLDAVQVASAPGRITTILSQQQQAVATQVGFVGIAAGGVGYTHANVAILGDGSGAAAIAYVSNGSIIGIALTNAGTGYTNATAIIAGDGSGAMAAVQIGLPILEQRSINLRCSADTVFAQAGSEPLQQNWTNFDVTVPAGTELSLTGQGGNWRAGMLTLADYIEPDGNGGLLLKTVSGDLVLQPSGRLRIASATEAAGISSSVGRGVPNGVVAATPGSDYRNLNGGAGATFWIKQTGNATTGWVALA